MNNGNNLFALSSFSFTISLISQTDHWKELLWLIKFHFPHIPHFLQQHSRSR
ncbi:conserved exported hypothetical protein [Xenorhabdus szentirmaii DSM 16338]|uniref:Uncharacterized protein n=1 Tax=Xenorhabdus szentirmaii DSM 16338 TaxID=1427518 RepID=W1J0R2_9GAMM|nr:conserved exported hypothetical protein [Xenorhabdus szentirmaii DSM 16338]